MTKHQFLFNVSLVVMAIFISVGIIYSVQAEGIDTTSCGEEFEIYYLDADGDTYGDINHAIMACTLPDGYSVNSNDCDDTDSSVNPDADEVCDGIDNDCNGDIDEDVKTIFYYDNDLDGYGLETSTTSACEAPADYAASYGDCDDNDETTFPGAPELCDDIDNDCNGAVDDDCSNTTTYYLDHDNDGYGNNLYPVEALEKPEGYVLDNTDCDDSRDDRYPGNTEVCDGIDNDCDEEVDEGINCGTYYTYYRDADGDTFGDENSTIRATSQPSGYVSDKTDCDDGNADKYPGNTEVCDGLDNDCDGAADEGGVCDDFNTYFRDADGDLYGNPDVSLRAISRPTGYVIDNTDCDDGNASKNPGETEICDGLDNDCDGYIDEGSVCETFHTYYRDADGDGYGNPDVSIEATSRPAGYVSNDDDCDDGNADKYPGNTEVCDGLDNDCDGDVDEGGVCDNGDVDNEGEMGDGYHEEKVAVCHIPPGNPAAAHTIYVGAPAVRAHLAHGDYEGECDGSTQQEYKYEYEHAYDNGRQNKENDKGKKLKNKGKKK